VRVGRGTRAEGAKGPRSAKGGGEAWRRGASAGRGKFKRASERAVVSASPLPQINIAPPPTSASPCVYLDLSSRQWTPVIGGARPRASSSRRSRSASIGNERHATGSVEAWRRERRDRCRRGPGLSGGRHRCARPWAAPPPWRGECVRE
jgi:hypothetical protein